jgi:hypothetical protein
MGDIAGGSRFVAGCARCLRTALAGIRTTDDEDGLVETRRTRRSRGSSFSLAGLRLASSVAVASGSQRVSAALASIPIVDEDELEGAGQAGLRRRMALASPAVAAGLLAGAVTTAPAGAQEAPASTAAAPAQKIQPQQPQPPAPAPPQAQPPMMIELTGGAGVPTPIGPWGGELGILVNPEDGSFQFTGLGGVYAGGKLSGEYRPARDPGVVGEAKLQGGLGPYSVDLVGQTDLQSVTGSWKAQGGPLVAGQTFEVLPNPSVETRGGAQARLPGPSAVGGLVGAAGVRATSPVIPIDLLAVVDEWQNSQPIDPARFEGVPAPEDPWVSLINWVNDQFGSQGSPQAPADSSGAGELLGAYGQQVGVPGASSGSGGLLGAYADQIGAQGAQGGTLRPVDLTQLQEQFAEAWNELAEADPSGGMAATTPSADDLAVLGEALNQLWGQITGNAGNAAPGPLPLLPPAFDQLIAQDPGLAQLLAQLGAQDPALAQLIVQDPALAQLLAQNPGLAQALAQDPTLAPALSQALAPVPTGEAGAPPAMDWGQILQDMNGPVLVDPEAFQDQPASDMDELDAEDADTDEADTDDTDGVDEPAFDMDDMDDVDDMDDADSESDDGGEDDSESPEPESEDDSESDDGDDEEPSDDWAEDDESEPESEDDSESETETDTDDGESEEESESDDGESEEESEPESDDDGGDESESESDDDGGDESESDDEGGEEESESDDGGGSDESDGGGGEEGDGGGESEPAPDDSGGGGESDGGGGGETDAPAPAAPDSGPAPEEPAESAEIGPEYEADSSGTGMVEDSGPCDVC